MSSKRMGLSSKTFFVALLAWLLVFASVLPSSAQTAERPSGWTDESHGNRIPANYEVVLPDGRVSEIFIKFTPEAWAAEEADMVEIYGERGSGGGRGPGGRGAGRPPQPNPEEIAAMLNRDVETVQAALALFPDFDAVAQALEMEAEEFSEALGIWPGNRRPPAANRGDAPGGGQGFGGPNTRNPIWVPVTVEFGGQTWWQVGFRYKGNTALSMSWGSNATALPFKLDFDEFEDDNPELDNQRFYGFKQLGFANNFGDFSLQREKVAADVFRAAGVPASQTAFYAVYVDIGDGDGFQPWGFYTAVELPDDTLVETQFADDDGNMYKPSGAGAAFAAGSFTESSFPKRTNRESDFADVLALFDALHDEIRLSNPFAWREKLEEVFDVERFLRWLASNQFVQKKDTYGARAKDFYLYADSASGQLVWIPYDNNEAMDDGSLGGLSPRGPGPGRADSGRGGPADWNFLLDEIDAEAWPLIGFLAEDDQYRLSYVELIETVASDVFASEIMTAIYDDNYQMLAAYATENDIALDIEALRDATDGLIAHVHERAEAATAFLQSQTNV